MNLSRFETQKGYTVYTTVKLLPMLTQQDCYIFDIGTQTDQDRLSLYLDTMKTLNLRYIDSKGNVFTVNHGKIGDVYSYGQWVLFISDITTIRSGENFEIMLRLESNRWETVKTWIIDSHENNFDFFHNVLGSSVDGNEHTHMSLFSHYIYSKIQTPIDRKQITKDIQDALHSSKIKNESYLKGNEFKSSDNHPNFLGKSSDDQSK